MVEKLHFRHGDVARYGMVDDEGDCDTAISKHFGGLNLSRIVGAADFVSCIRNAVFQVIAQRIKGAIRQHGFPPLR